MKLIIDISKDKYDEIMAMDWKNCRLIFGEEIRAIHDGEVLEQKPCDDAISREAVMHILDEVGGDFDSPREAVVPIDYIADMVSELQPVTAQPCEDAISRQAVLDEIDKRFDLAKPFKQLIKSMPPVTTQPKPGYISIDDAMSAFDDFMCNDIEPEGQEVFLELLKDRAERSKE